MSTTSCVPNKIVVPMSPIPEIEIDIPHNQIIVSPTAAQITRRKTFKENSLSALADSLKIAQLQAILVRPLPMIDELPRYEIVFGERRWLASQIARKPTIRALVKVMTDQEALDAQLAENLDRDELDPFAEAAGYQDLLKTHGLTHQQIAARYDHSVRHVVSRLLLLQLSPAVREAFDKEEIRIESVDLIARIPHHALQLEALKAARIKDDTGEPMSPARLRVYINNSFMLDLSTAPFDTADATLIPDIGPCGTCPKRTGNQNVLFSDIKARDICTDPTCFKQKRDAALMRKSDQARSNGQTIIRGLEAKKIAPHGSAESLNKGYIALDSICHAHPKHKTFRELLGRAAPVPDLLEMPKSKDLIDVVRGETIAPILEKKGIKIYATHTPTKTPQSDESKKRQLRVERERLYRTKLFQEIRGKHPADLTTQQLRTMAENVFSLLPQDDKKRLVRLLQWEPGTIPDYLHLNRVAHEHLDKLNQKDLTHFMLNCVLVREVYVSGYSDEEPALLKQFAADYGINPRTVRAACARDTDPTRKKGASRTSAVKSRKAAVKAKPAKVPSRQPVA
jgi:ParB/RepB/Spo0J family partition protein